MFLYLGQCRIFMSCFSTVGYAAPSVSTARITQRPHEVLPLSLCLSQKCKARGFTVIVDGRKSQWNIVKTVVLMLQVQT